MLNDLHVHEPAVSGQDFLYWGVSLHLHSPSGVLTTVGAELSRAVRTTSKTHAVGHFHTVAVANKAAAEILTRISKALQMPRQSLLT